MPPFEAALFDTVDKSTGQFSRSLILKDGEPDVRYRPRIVRYEKTWNVMSHGRRSVPFQSWEDARAFALCVFYHPEVLGKPFGGTP